MSRPKLGYWYVPVIFTGMIFSLLCFFNNGSMAFANSVNGPKWCTRKTPQATTNATPTIVTVAIFFILWGHGADKFNERICENETSGQLRSGNFRVHDSSSQKAVSSFCDLLYAICTKIKPSYALRKSEHLPNTGHI